MQCQAFDVIGSVGFGKVFNAAADLASEGARSCHAVEQGQHILTLESCYSLYLALDAQSTCYGNFTPF